MGMRGKKKKKYTFKQKQAIKSFRLWVEAELQKEIIEQIRNYDPVPDVMNGCGVSNNLKGISA